jgi:hypothetical protein
MKNERRYANSKITPYASYCGELVVLNRKYKHSEQYRGKQSNKYYFKSVTIKKKQNSQNRGKQNAPRLYIRAKRKRRDVGEAKSNKD